MNRLKAEGWVDKESSAFFYSRITPTLFLLICRKKGIEIAHLLNFTSVETQLLGLLGNGFPFFGHF